MLPKEIKPEVEKVEIKALKLDLEAMTMAGQSRVERRTTADDKKKTKAPPKKRDPQLNVPNDAFLGFRTAGQLNHAAAVKAGPSPGKELRERKRSALLTADQESELRERWQFAGDDRVRPAPFDFAQLPFERGHTGSALKIPMHGQRHLDALSLLKTYDAMCESKPDDFNRWHAKMSQAFDPKLVTFWNPPKDEDGGTPRRRRLHTRVQHSPPVPDPPSSMPPNPASASTESSPPPAKRPRITARPPPPPAQTVYQGERPTASPIVKDPYNVLSSDAEVEVEVEVAVLKPKPAAVPPPPKPLLQPAPDPEPQPEVHPGDDSIFMDDDGFEFDMHMTDSQLLSGAFVVQPKAVVGGHSEDDVVVDDSEDDLMLVLD